MLSVRALGGAGLSALMSLPHGMCIDLASDGTGLDLRCDAEPELADSATVKLSRSVHSCSWHAACLVGLVEER